MLRLSSKSTKVKEAARRSYSSATTMSRKILRSGEIKAGAEVRSSKSTAPTPVVVL